jgi:hypothetical protein
MRWMDSSSASAACSSTFQRRQPRLVVGAVLVVGDGGDQLLPKNVPRQAEVIDGLDGERERTALPWFSEHRLVAAHRRAERGE